MEFVKICRYFSLKGILNGMVENAGTSSGYRVAGREIQDLFIFF